MVSTAALELEASVNSAPACPTMVPDTTDPRIRRTRDLLQQALASLLAQREFDHISVQDITGAATVNRATFYAHYPDKFALLECLVGGRFQALLTARGVVFDGTCFGALQGIMLGVCDYLAQTLDQNSTHPVTDRQMEPHMESAIVAVVRGMILHGISRHPPANSLPPAILASTVSWAIYGAAREWALTPDRDPSEEIAASVVDLVLPILNGSSASG